VNRPGTVLLSLLACGCASASPEIAPAGVAGSAFASTVDNRAYDEMAIAAASQLRNIIPGKTIGVYHSTSSPTLRELVKAVIDEYDFREVRAGESRVVCAPRNRGRGVVSPAMPACTIDVADVVLQLSSVQITNDSGYIGGLRTEVPTGAEKVRTTAFCLIAVRQRNHWEAARYAAVETPRDCASDGKH
jgi:hypothetical protein